MKTILYATDYSKNSVNALRFAHDLSIKLNAKLQVIHVYHYPTVFVDELKEPDSFIDKNEFEKHTLRLKYFCEKHLGKNLGNVGVKAVKHKSVLEGVLDKAKIVNPIFIVVGSKGLTDFKDLIMGNTTKNLIENGLFPVLSIPSKGFVPELKTIVYATAFEEDDVQAICRLTEIAKPLDAAIKVVHVSSKKDYPGNIQMEWFKEMLNEKVDYDNIDFEVIASDDVFNSLRDYADKMEADLLAMLERKKGGFLRNLLNKDTIQKMNDYGKYPLISFNVSNALKLNLS